MITSISVSNHRGVCDTVELSVPSSDGPVIRSPIVAGRTSFVSAVTFMTDHLREPHAQFDPMPYVPNRLGGVGKPAKFSVGMELDVDGKRRDAVYDLSFDDGGIIDESLRIGRRRVFDRSEGVGMKKDILKRTSERSAYLSMASLFNDKECTRVYRDIRGIRTVSMSDTDPTSALMEMDAHPETKDTVCGWLGGMGIEIAWVVMKYGRGFELRVGHGDYVLDWSAESGRFRRMLPCMPAMADVFLKGGILLVDDYGMGMDDDTVSMMEGWFSGCSSGGRMVAFTGWS